MGKVAPWTTSNEDTATALTTITVSNFAPTVDHLASTNSTPEGSYPDITISVPFGTSAGDMLLAQIGRNGPEGHTITAVEGGWNAVFENLWEARESVTSSECLDFGGSMSVFWRTATASEPANYSWDYDTSNSPHAIGAIATISRHNPTSPIGSFVTDTSTACGPGPGTPPRTIDPGHVIAATNNTMTVAMFCVTETFMASGAPLDPIGFTWSKQFDRFKGPIPTSLQLQMHTQNSNLVAGDQGAITHADLDGFIETPSIVNATLSIAPVITGPDTGTGYSFTSDDAAATVTITAPSGTGNELNGQEVVITVTGDVTVSQITTTLQGGFCGLTLSPIGIQGVVPSPFGRTLKVCPEGLNGRTLIVNECGTCQ